MPAGAFGAVRPVGAIPPTATAAGPSHTEPWAATPLRRPLPASHAQMMFSPLPQMIGFLPALTPDHI